LSFTVMNGLRTCLTFLTASRLLENRSLVSMKASENVPLEMSPLYALKAPWAVSCVRP